MERIIRIGMDTSKHVFQLDGVNAAEEPVLRKTLRRNELIKFFEKLPPTMIGIEACGDRITGGACCNRLGMTLSCFLRNTSSLT